VYHTLQIMQQHGYPAPLDSDSNNANIFYHEDDGSRILLERSGNQWIGKNEEVLISPLLHSCQSIDFRFGSRILLERSGNQWIGKNEEVVKSTEEMYDIANNAPWRLSTNVVTRPIMQELIFPSLAFVAGDGEISY